MRTLGKRAAVAALATVLLAGGGLAVAAPAVEEEGAPRAVAWEWMWSGLRSLLGLDGPRSEAGSAEGEPEPEQAAPPPAAPTGGGGGNDSGGSLDPDG